MCHHHPNIPKVTPKWLQSDPKVARLAQFELSVGYPWPLRQFNNYQKTDVHLPRWESRSEIHCTPSRNYKVPHLEIIRLDIILKIYIACLSCMHISYADLAWITSQINTLISNTRSYVASSPFRGRHCFTACRCKVQTVLT